jgi:small-conductance mechanosensitive channel
MQDFLAQVGQHLSAAFGPELLNVARALGILVVGWLIALAAAAAVRGALKRTTIDNQVAKWVLGEETEKGAPVEGWIARAVYYLLLIFVLVAVLNALNLTLVSQPLTEFLNRVLAYIPRVVGAALLLAVAWAIATVLRRIVAGALEMAKLDERIGGDVGVAGAAAPPLSKTLSETVYWLVLLLFLPNILEALALRSLLTPIQGLLDRILGFLPNLLAALIILAVGWFVARVVQRILTNLLAAAGTDSFAERVGLGAALGGRRFSGLIGLVVYVLILVPVVIEALRALRLEAITDPASQMLGRILEAVPVVFAAALLLLIAYVVARLVAGLLASVLAGVGFDNLLERMGLARTGKAKGARIPSAVVGTLTVVAIMLFASIEAAALLGFANLAGLLTGFVQFAGQVILGLVIFGVGLYLASVAAEAIRSGATAQAGTLALAARISIIVLAAAMGLRQMGLANEIIQLAFGALIGAIAVAAALAFGLGGRDLATKELASWREGLRSR